MIARGRWGLCQHTGRNVELLLYSSLFETEIALKKGQLNEIGPSHIHITYPSAFELNLAQVIVQSVYATSQNSNSWKGKMNKHLFCNSCAVGGWFKPPYNAFFLKYWWIPDIFSFWNISILHPSIRLMVCLIFSSQIVLKEVVWLLCFRIYKIYQRKRKLMFPHIH